MLISKQIDLIVVYFRPFCAEEQEEVQLTQKEPKDVKHANCGQITWLINCQNQPSLST